MSQSDLAERAGVSRQTISRIERAAGYVGLDVLERLATALGTTIGTLVEPYVPDDPDDDEIARRVDEPRDDYVDARALLAAMDEAGSSASALERFSRAGRPPVSRPGASARHKANR